MSDSSSAYEKSPFDDPSTDIVLRSSDDVEFHVHRLILSLASVVFTDILSLPQDPQSKHVDGKPTVDLLEDGNTLRHLLLYCYPTPKPRLEHPNEIIPVLKAAFKYEMHGPREELITALRHAAHVDPVRVWSFAVSQNGLDDVVRRAARHIKSHMSGAPALAMLEKNLRAAGLEEVLSEVSTGAYFRLREYIGGPDGTTPLRLEPALSESDAAADAPLSALELAKTCATFIPAHPPPDATLRCSDGVELKVHLLELVRCKLGSCPEDGDPAVYRVDARGHVVVCVLQVCYAKGDLDFMSTFDHVAGILSTFRSLHVCADLESRVKRYWDTKVARSVQRGDGAPLEAYLAAVQYGLKQEEIKAAVRCTLERTLVEVPYMEEASALAYHKLLTCHAHALRRLIPWLEGIRRKWKSHTCHCHFQTTSWMEVELNKLEADLRHGKLRPAESILAGFSLERSLPLVRSTVMPLASVPLDVYPSALVDVVVWVKKQMASAFRDAYQYATDMFDMNFVDNEHSELPSTS